MMKCKKKAHEAMKLLFKQIPTMKSKPLSHDKKYQLFLTYIGCTVSMKSLTIISGQLHLLHQFDSDFDHLLGV